MGSLVREVGQARASSRWWRWVTRMTTPVRGCAPTGNSHTGITEILRISNISRGTRIFRRSRLVTVRLYPLRYRDIATMLYSSDLLVRASGRARWRQALGALAPRAYLRLSAASALALRSLGVPLYRYILPPWCSRPAAGPSTRKSSCLPRLMEAALRFSSLRSYRTGTHPHRRRDAEPDGLISITPHWRPRRLPPAPRPPSSPLFSLSGPAARPPRSQPSRHPPPLPRPRLPAHLSARSRRPAGPRSGSNPPVCSCPRLWALLKSSSSRMLALQHYQNSVKAGFLVFPELMAARAVVLSPTYLLSLGPFRW